MANAVIEVEVAHGSNGSEVYASAEGGIIWNRDDAEDNGSPAIVPPTAPASNYSNYKLLQLKVTTLGTTNVTNIRARLASAPASGLALFAKAVASYDQCTGNGATQGNRPADTTVALTASPKPNVPVGYTLLTDSGDFVVDSGVYATSGTGLLGSLIQALLGVSSSYAGALSTGVAVPSLTISYDEY